MPNRFEDAPEETVELVDKVRSEVFPELGSANIKVIYDTKKRMSGGKIVLGRMQKTNDLLRHLTATDAMDEEGYDYILYLCEAAFTNIDESDKIRLIRHELRHANVDLDSDTNPYKIVGHELEDFYDEIEYNRNDPRWAERCVMVAESVYSED